jgi:beta-fructofuranosidase
MGISHENGCRYYVGDWKDEQFHPEIHERMSWVDNTFFAPESMADPNGRRLMWAWIFDQRDKESEAAAGWSGVFSIPRELWLRDDLRLGMRPIEELKSLRYNERSLESRTLRAGETVDLMSAPENGFELEATFEAGTASAFGLKVCCAHGNGGEETVVGYDRETGELFVDTTRSSAREMGPKVREAGPFALAPSESLRLRVFVDRSVVEVFANERQAITRRIYPGAASLGIKAYSTGGDSRLGALDFWEMMPSNPY